eukprot:12169777-Ditylum_brightwellii.AAC.1
MKTSLCDMSLVDPEPDPLNTFLYKACIALDGVFIVVLLVSTCFVVHALDIDLCLGGLTAAGSYA